MVDWLGMGLRGLQSYYTRADKELKHSNASKSFGPRHVGHRSCSKYKPLWFGLWWLRKVFGRRELGLRRLR